MKKQVQRSPSANLSFLFINCKFTWPMRALIDTCSIEGKEVCLSLYRVCKFLSTTVKITWVGKYHRCILDMWPEALHVSLTLDNIFQFAKFCDGTKLKLQFRNQDHVKYRMRHVMFQICLGSSRLVPSMKTSNLRCP
jgi:hypothetical protein